MTKLMSIIAASALALSVSGAAFAADQKTDQPAYPKTQDQTGAPKTQDQGATPADQSKQDQEYFVALKKCQSLQEPAKQECIDQAKQRYNRM
jgi:Spy/CpxP family protein refolding chaperone